jgi:hypothetical protein
MQSFSIKTVLILIASSTLLVEAFPFINTQSPRIRQDPGLQERGTGGTGTVTKVSALGLGVTSTAAAAQASATTALNATVLNCEIIVR